jgi:hypothetical protein
MQPEAFICANVWVSFAFGVGLMCAAVFIHELMCIWEEKYQRKRAERKKREHMKKLENEQ